MPVGLGEAALAWNSCLLNDSWATNSCVLQIRFVKVGYLVGVGNNAGACGWDIWPTFERLAPRWEKMQGHDQVNISFHANVIALSGQLQNSSVLLFSPLVRIAWIKWSINLIDQQGLKKIGIKGEIWIFCHIVCHIEQCCNLHPLCDRSTGFIHGLNLDSF